VTRAWPRPVWAGVALLLAGSPVGAVVQGTAWWGYAAGAVALVVAVGLLTTFLRSAAARPPAPLPRQTFTLRFSVIRFIPILGACLRLRSRRIERMVCE